MCVLFIQIHMWIGSRLPEVESGIIYATKVRNIFYLCSGFESNI